MSINYTADQLQRKFPGSAGSTGYARLADVLRKEDRLEEAIALCQEGLRQRPNHLSGYLVLGKCLLDGDRLEEAREQFEAALRVDPRCLSAMHALARIMDKLQWQEAAVGYYRSILAVEPWDREIQALGGMPPPEARKPFSELQPAPDADHRFANPSDLSQISDAGPIPTPRDNEDVIEFNLNQMADFLPKEDTDSLSEGLEEIALDDSVSGQDVENRLDSIFGTGNQAPAAAAPAIPAFPTAEAPVFQPAAPQPAEPADASTEEESPPISGRDVEDRLDALFGFVDEPAPSAGPAAAPSFVRDAEGPETPFGGMEAPIAGPEAVHPIADEAEAPPISGQDVEDRLDSLFGFDDAPPARTAPAEAKAASKAEPIAPEAAFFPETPAAAAVPDSMIFPDAAFPAAAVVADAGDRPAVTGQDVEDRLDSLFDLGTATDTMPVHRQTQAMDAPDATAGIPSESMGMQSADTVFAPFETDAPADGQVQGKDVENRLDDLFSLSPEPEAAEADQPPEVGYAPETESRDEVLLLDPEPGTHTLRIQEPIDGQDVADKLDSLFGAEQPTGPDAGEERGFVPEITGADIEDQLDKLFQLDDGPKAGPERPAAETAGFAAAAGDGSGTVTFEGRSAHDSKDPGGAPGAGEGGSMPGDERDRTLIMPAMKESPADWLAGQSETPADRADRTPPRMGGEEGRDTLILNVEEISGLPDEGDGYPSAASGSGAEPPKIMDARETGVFRFVADEGPGGADPGDADAASMEMVDGTDVGERLDQIFGAEKAPETATPRPAPGETPLDLELFTPDGPAGMTRETGNAGFDSVVSGEGLDSRLEEIFDEVPEPPMPEVLEGAEQGVVQPTEDFEPILPPEETDLEFMPEPELDRETGASPEPVGLSALQAGVSPPAAPQSRELAPLTDEDEAYPDEEEASQEGTGANVATVTLAEIYFQQGLKEQALQIYRQLLEREPSNESVRKRIQDIEATKPEGESRGADADHRRPRPGMKVPKRKK